VPVLPPSDSLERPDYAAPPLPRAAPFDVCFFAALRICDSNDMLADEETIRWPEVAGLLAASNPATHCIVMLPPAVSGKKVSTTPKVYRTFTNW